MENTFETVSGVKIVSLVFAFIGAALGITYTPELTKRMALAAMIAGVVTGGLGPEVIAWAFNLQMPRFMNNIAALICGVGGMFIFPGLLTVWKGFASDPWGFVDRLRGIKKPDDKTGG